MTIHLRGSKEVVNLQDFTALGPVTNIVDIFLDGPFDSGFSLNISSAGTINLLATRPAVMRLPLLTTVDVSFTLKGNLTRVDKALLEKFGGTFVVQNTLIQALKAPKLFALGRGLTISNNTAPESVSFPYLE